MSADHSNFSPPPDEIPDDVTVPADAAYETGLTIGRYILRERIGSGGMGEVWRAEQTAPVRRTVAVKLIKAGMDSHEVLARFEAERQALALMNHPGIAKVYDAGTTPSGRPFFAMEYVPGVPVTEYCDKRRLDMRSRLRLFQRICDAVQHAHQKAVLHRDLKPGNVLVSDVDGQPVPKVIDFGVAKATTQKLTESTMYTALGQLIGTPEYMSPEQAEMAGEDVDTRTDVYSLGVILYEVLVGALPFESKDLRKAGFEGIVKMLREQEPSKPSTRLSTLGAQTTEIANRRCTVPRRLAHELKGDLDWIVMRCLEKDRNRRYDSPRELQRDIERHLNLEPVMAGPPSQMYRLRKFVVRNRLAVAVAAVLVLSVTVGIVGTTQGMLRAQKAERTATREAATATAVSDFLLSLFEKANPYAETGDTLRVAALLDRGSQRIDIELAGQPELHAKMLASIGTAYQGLGMPNRSIDHHERAVAILNELSGADDVALALSRIDLASAIFWGRRYDPEQVARAKEVFDAGFATLLNRLSPEDPRLIWPHHGLALYYVEIGDPEAAYEFEMKAIAICEANPTEGDACLDLQAQLGDILLSLGDLDGAERVVREVNERKGVKFSHKMGRVLRAKGKYVEAISQYTQVLDAKRSKLPPDHPDLGFELNAISITYELMGDLESAIDYAEQAAQVRRHYGAGSAMATGMLLRVAGLYARAGDLERAEAPFREAWPALVQNPDWIGHAIFKLGGQDPTRTRDAVDSFVTLLRNIGQEKAAEDLVVWAAGVAQGS